MKLVCYSHSTNRDLSIKRVEINVLKLAGPLNIYPSTRKGDEVLLQLTTEEWKYYSFYLLFFGSESNYNTYYHCDTKVNKT